MDLLNDPPPPTAHDGGQPATDPVQPCPREPVRVQLNLSADVACPGHLLPVAAVGTPAGGTYTWTVSGARAVLLDGYKQAANTGDQLNFLSFYPDDSDGNIPHCEAEISVTYTCPEGSDSTSKKVPVHGITFEVDGETQTKCDASAMEQPDYLWFTNEMRTIETKPGEKAGVATLGYAELYVRIHLEKICPRKAECAGNHRVGWLQTLLSSKREMRYQERIVCNKVYHLPCRDQARDGVNPPFYGYMNAFKGDGDARFAKYEDTPSQQVPWTHVAAGANPKEGPYTQYLRRFTYAESFQAWLVVQNLEQYERNRDDASFVYLRNLPWSLQATVQVDMAKPLGSRCAPRVFKAAIPAALATGKGSVKPVVSGMPPMDRDGTYLTDDLDPHPLG